MFTQKTVEHAKEFLKDSNFEFLKLVSESNGNKKAIFEVKCKKCGAIRRTNLSNLKRFGCDHCAHLYKMPQSAPKTQEQFIKEASYVHNNFYDYFFHALIILAYSRYILLLLISLLYSILKTTLVIISYAREWL